MRLREVADVDCPGAVGGEEVCGGAADAEGGVAAWTERGGMLDGDGNRRLGTGEGIIGMRVWMGKRGHQELGLSNVALSIIGGDCLEVLTRYDHDFVFAFPAPWNQLCPFISRFQK